MAGKIESRKNDQVDAGQETVTFALGVGIAMAALIGIWSVVCLFSALSTSGPMNIIKGLLGTITG